MEPKARNRARLACSAHGSAKLRASPSNSLTNVLRLLKPRTYWAQRNWPRKCAKASAIASLHKLCSPLISNRGAGDKISQAASNDESPFWLRLSGRARRRAMAKNGQSRLDRDAQLTASGSASNGGL